MELNEIQKKAVESINKNLSLGAGAGTGKTSVLTKRYINILKNARLSPNKEIEEILAITFTKKAARDMKSKIKKELLQAEDEDLKKYRADFSRAKIFTIHGFCSELIKENSLLVSLSPSVEVIDDFERNEMLRNAFKKTIEELEKDQELYELLFNLGYTSFDKLENLIISLYSNIKTKGYSISEIEKLNDDFNSKLKSVDLDSLIELLKAYKELKTGSKFQNFSESEEFKKFLQNKDYEFIFEVEKNLGTSKKVDLEREEIEEEIRGLKKNLEVYNYSIYKKIIELVKSLSKNFKNMKKENKLIDYDDLEFYGLEILKKTKQNFKYIMVDEFQDTNYIQCEILRLLCDDFKEDVKLFIVGDIKQSIYGFRGSNILEYIKFTKNFDKSSKLDMVDNYRSTSKLIESFNFIFEDVFKDIYVRLNANINGEEKIKLLEYKEDEVSSVVNYVRELVDNNVLEKDIAILFRSKKNINLYESALRKVGLRVVNTSKEFKKVEEIRDVLIFLKAIGRSNIIDTLAYFKSPFVGLSEDAIFLLANQLRDGELSIDFKNIFDKEKDRELFEIGYFNLLRYKEIFKFLNINKLISLILMEENFYEIANILYGKSSKENLDSLLEKSIEFEHISNDISDFINYINSLEVEENKGEGVNLLTIHKSKGLEYKNVILVDCQKDFSKLHYKDLIEVGDNGLGINNKINFKYKDIKEKEKIRQIEEEKRIFYVALTRAKENLILSVADKKSPEYSYWSLIEKSGFTDYEKISGKESFLKDRHEVDIKEKIENIKSESSYNLYLQDSPQRKKYLKTYSPTSYMTYKRDKDLFFRKYILNIDFKDNITGEQREGIDPRIRGLIVHKFAEIRPKDENEFIINELAKYEIVASKENIGEILFQIKNLKARYSDKSLYREFEFYYKIKNAIINGFVDEIREVEDGLEIIDYKTGQLLDERENEIYCYQLQIYTFAIEKILKRKVVEAKLISLYNNKIIKADISKEALSNRIKDFEKFVDWVEKIS